MEIGLAAAAVAFAAFVLYRSLSMRRELRRMTGHLAAYNRGETTASMTIATWDRSLERLAEELNRHTELVVRANAERKRTEEELRQAVADMSHDLRTPLTSISGYIQLLESRELSEERRREALGVVKTRAARLQSLLDDFFELTVLESVDYTLRPEKLRLDRLLPDVLLGFYDKWSGSGAEPRFSIPDEPMAVVADESAVRRVVENLMANTLRHANGEIVVSLRAADGRALLTVENDAPQLRGFQLELLFNRFYMADRSRTGGGSGLGLSIARGLMQKMGGDLAAEMTGDRLRMVADWPLATAKPTRSAAEEGDGKASR